MGDLEVGLCCVVLCCSYIYNYVMFLYHNFKIKHKIFIALVSALPTSKISFARLQSQCA